MTPLRNHKWPLAILFLLPILWWWPLLCGYLPDYMDTVTHTYPLRLAVAEQVWSGTLPLWLPNQFSGMPLAANPQVAVWYPPQALFYLFPSPVMHGLLAIGHYVLAGAGMYALIFWHARRKDAALFAAALLQLSPMLVGRIALLPHVYTMAWVPWLFLLSEWTLRERHRWPGLPAFLLGWALAMQVLAGAPQVTYYTGMALLLFWGTRTLVPAGGAAPLRERLLRGITHGTAAALLAVLLAGVQIVPMFDLAREVERSSLTIERLASGALNDGQRWRALFGWSGEEHEDTDTINAIGAGAMLLAVAAVALAGFRRKAFPYLAVGAGAYLLALGPLSGFWNAVLPLYDHFHAPRRSLMFWTVCGSALAGLGSVHLANHLSRRAMPRWVLPALLVAAFASNFWVLVRMERVFTGVERFALPGEIANLLQGSRFLTVDPTLSYSYDSRREDYGRSLAPNMAAWHGLLDVQGYDPLVLRRYALARDAASARSGIFYPSHGAFFTDPNSPVLSMLGVRHLVGRWDIFDPGLLVPGASIDSAMLGQRVTLAHDAERWPVYTFEEERPLAWVASETHSARGPGEAIQLAIVNDPYRYGFLEVPVTLPPLNNPPDAELWVPGGRSMKVTLSRTVDQYSLLVVSSTWMEGWQAVTAAGEPAETLPVHGFLTGVLLPPGTQAVTLRYEPVSFRYGAALSAVGLLLGTLLLRLRLQKESRPGDDSRTGGIQLS